MTCLLLDLLPFSTAFGPGRYTHTLTSAWCLYFPVQYGHVSLQCTSLYTSIRQYVDVDIIITRVCPAVCNHMEKDMKRETRIFEQTRGLRSLIYY